MRKLLISLALAVALAAPAMARNVTPAYKVMGVGTRSCAGFASDFLSAPDHDARQDVVMTYFVWSQGYMSALNDSAGSNARNLNALTTRQQEFFLRQYCDAHPLKVFDQGVLALFMRLPKVAK